MANETCQLFTFLRTHFCAHYGSDITCDDITRDSLCAVAREAGLGERMAMRRFDAMTERFRTALHESAVDLICDGYKKAGELEIRILETAGIRSVL